MKRIIVHFQKRLIFIAFLNAFKKFNPRSLIRNPVMFITAIGALISTLEIFFAHEHLFQFTIHIACWLWFTVFFANFSEAFSEARNHAQADSLKKSKQKIFAHLLDKESFLKETKKNQNLTKIKTSLIKANTLKKEDFILVYAGETIPADGEIVTGTASIDESSVTGESAAVIRSAGSDQNTVVAGTKILSDALIIRITSNPGESYLDKMISLIEGAKRKKTPNELALTILLSGLTFIFLLVIISLKTFGRYFHLDFSFSMLVAFLICLIPTTIASLLSAIGIAGINRLLRHNVLAMSGQAIEAAGDIDIIMIDKTGTITLGNRRASRFIPDKGVFEEDLIKAAYLTSISDETTEGKSIFELALLEQPNLKKLSTAKAIFIPFSASTRISGVDLEKSSFRKGAKDTIEKFCKKSLSSYLQAEMDSVARGGSTPLLVCSKSHILGVIELKDIIKPGLAEQFHRFDLMGQKTVMVTGDNQITAAAISKEAGLSDFLAEASPEDKLHYLQKMQARGYMVAMTGDGVNDAPALAYANVGVAMNAGTEAAKEAGNMIDLDSSPAKLLSIIEIGKQMLITRGALTTFSTANDVAKYFTILPAMLMPVFPFFHALNVMNLSTPQRAILSAVIFNALIIVALIPLAFKGVKFTPQKAATLLRRNLLIYGVGGIILPFIGIKAIDMLLTVLGVL